MSDEQPFVAPSFFISAGFLATIVVAGTVLVFWPDGDDDPGASTGTSTDVSRAETSASPLPHEEQSFTPSASGSLCGLEPHATDFEMLFPIQDTSWTTINGMRAPEAPDLGPGVRSNGVRYCYARTPEGAVLAAANFLVLVNFGQEEMRGRWDLLIAPGPDRETLISEIEGRTEPAEVAGQISAARVVSYTEDDARISIAIAATSGDRASMTFDLTWTEGDWKVVLDEEGGNNANFTILEDLSGFTPWAAI